MLGIIKIMKHTPLFESGFYDVPFSNFKEMSLELLVKPFAGSQRREMLADRLFALLTEVANVCIFTEAWIDGSFVTDKEEPNDVDIILWHNTLPSISPRELRIYRELRDDNLMMSRYRCDVYLAANGNGKLRRYWTNWFGYDRTQHPKGIIRVIF